MPAEPALCSNLLAVALRAFLAALAPGLLGFLLLLNALSCGFHLLLFALFHREDCAMFRAAPADPDVMEFRHEVFAAYFALTA